ncbi:hypothetical protein DPMN_014941 [Dreissena polymorpha]|uniref:Uncharacterized protein n=1 Tax=Dreissena polymorpha TaxID=45954 RepID=A0A9D4S5Q5_DREPO|nr:hypothetical protein DPMN_014941 [Dreissena polymorpha]
MNILTDGRPEDNNSKLRQRKVLEPSKFIKVEEDAFGNDHPKKMEKQLAFYDMQRASRKFYSDRTLEEHIEDNLGKHRKWE